MVGDYFTKPVQGGLFKKLRDYIMGTTMFPIEERVEIQNKKEGNKNQAKNVAIENRVILNHKNKEGKTYLEAVTQRCDERRYLV